METLSEGGSQFLMYDNDSDEEEGNGEEPPTRETTVPYASQQVKL